jgi:hypothetical protein
VGIRATIRRLTNEARQLLQRERPPSREGVAPQLAAMTLATVGTDAGPMKGVTATRLAKAIEAQNFDALAGVRRILETKARRQSGRKGNHHVDS